MIPSNAIDLVQPGLHQYHHFCSPLSPSLSPPPTIITAHLQPPEPFIFEYSITHSTSASNKVIDIKVDVPSDLQRRFNHIIHHHHHNRVGLKADDVRHEECVSLEKKSLYLSQLLENRLKRLVDLKAIADDPVQGLTSLLQSQKESAQVRVCVMVLYDGDIW